MFHRKTRHILTLSLVIVVISAAMSGIKPASAQQATRTVVADLNFRPDGNGFGFPNYGADTPVTNLTPAEMRRLLDDSVCAILKDNNCTLTPDMQQLMDTINGKMGGGHCEGMAVLSTLIFANKENAADFGQGQTTGFSFADNAKLQREIALWFSTQMLKTVSNATIKDKTPKEIVDILAKAMNDKSEYYVVHIFQPGFKNGHAITPYQIQDMGNGLFHIMVYDNNWPKDANRFVEVDTNANTWTYLAATSPDVPEAVYKGDATTLTLHLSPIGLRVTKQSCPTCQAANIGAQANTTQLVAYHPARVFATQAETQYNEVTIYSSSDVSGADLLITDAAGHRLGYQGDQFFTEIPGAQFIPVTSSDLFDDDPEPVYYIPVGTAFTVTLDGTSMQKDEVTNVSMVGPSYDLAVENIKLPAGKKDTMTFSPDGTKISYTPSSDQAPDVIVGIEHTGNDYEFTVKGADVQPGASVNVSLDYDKGRLGINTSGSGEKSATYAIEVDRISDTAEDSFSHDGLTLDPNATAYIEFGAWDGKGDMNVSIDTNSDGTAEQTQAQPNEHK
jgi:hypothetical protein